MSMILYRQVLPLCALCAIFCSSFCAIGGVAYIPGASELPQFLSCFLAAKTLRHDGFAVGAIGGNAYAQTAEEAYLSLCTLSNLWHESPSRYAREVPELISSIVTNADTACAVSRWYVDFLSYPEVEERGGTILSIGTKVRLLSLYLTSQCVGANTSCWIEVAKHIGELDVLAEKKPIGNGASNVPLNTAMIHGYSQDEMIANSRGDCYRAGRNRLAGRLIETINKYDGVIPREQRNKLLLEIARLAHFNDDECLRLGICRRPIR